MRKHLKRFFAVAALFALSATAMAQAELTVADGTTTNQYIPVYGYWVDAAQHNQILYPEDSLGDMTGGIIQGMTFYMSSTASSNWNTTVTISLATVTDASLSGLNTSATLTQVWQGTWSGQTSEISVDFDDEFTYDGGNLLVDIQTTAGTFSGGYFYGVTLSNASFYSYNSTSNTQNFLPKTNFSYIPGSGDYCYKPKNIVFSNPTNNGTDVSWTQPYGGGNMYSVFVDGVEVASGLTDTTYTISGLSANTEYTVQVVQVCSNGDSSSALNGSFRTLCQEGNCEIQVTPGSNYSYSSNYNPHVNVIQNGSVISSGNQPRTVEICNGDSVIVVYATAPSSTYYTPSLTVTDVAGTNLFEGSLGSHSVGDTLVAVANGCPSCLPVSVLTQTPTDAFSTTIHWTDNNVAGLGDYVVIINGVEYPVSGDSTYALSTWPLTHYDVSVARICEGNDTSAFRSISFNAPCDESVYAEVPFFSGFEELNQNESPDCWVQVQTGGNPGLGSVFPSAYRWAPNAHTGSVYFEFESSNGTETEILALPRMEDVSTLQLSFYASTTTSTYRFTLEAGVVELDDEGEYVFVPVDTIELQAGSSFSGSYHVYNVLFDTYEGNGERLALRTTPNPPTNSSIYTLMLDDFNVIRVGVPVLGPFDHSSYTINMGDTLHLNANLMTGEVDTWTWSSDMIESGDAVIVAQDSSAVTILYNAAGTDILTVTAANANGSASKSVTVNVIDNSLINEYPYSTGFEPGDDRSWYTDGDLNGWYIGTATATEEGGTSLYISRDNGATNVMADGLTCRSYAYRHFDMLNGGEFELDFWWKGNGTQGSRYMEVYIATGAVYPTHGSYPSSSWTRIATCYNASDWTEFNDVFEAEADTNTLIFYWYGTGNANPPHAVDNITIDKLNCSRVGNLEAHNVFAHSADIVWTPRNDEAEWWVVVDTNDGYAVTEDSIHLDGFDGETSHTVQVRAICADGDTSAARTVSFTTTIACPAVSNIHTDTVTATTATIVWTPGGEETAWKLVIGDGDTIDVSGEPTYVATGLEANTAYTVTVIANCGDLDGVSTSTTATIRTDCEGESCSVSVSYTYSYYQCDYELVQNGSSFGVSDDAASYTVCAGEALTLRTTGSTYGSSYYIVVTNAADIEMYRGTVTTTVDTNLGNPCPSCLPVTSISIDSVSTTSATVSWHPMSASNVESWVVYLDGVEYGTATDTTYTFTTLAANTVYTVGVRANCGEGDSSILRTTTLRTDCEGGSCRFTVEMADSYGDGWNGNAAINVYQNNSLLESLTIASGSSNVVTMTPCLGDSIFLFWRSGTWDSEVSFVIKDVNDSVLLTQGSMSNFSTGDTIMYFDGLCGATVVMSHGSTPGTDCAAPTNLSATATESSISIIFSGSASTYEVGIVEGSTWNEDDAETDEIYNTTYTFTELSEGTTYTVAVRSVCDDGWDVEYSDWVTTTVTTENTALPCACDEPTNLRVISRDTTHAVIDWTPGDNNVSWDVELDGNVFNVSNHPYAISNLEPGSTHSVRVRAHCCDNMQETSDWTAAITFTTDNAGSHEGISAADGIECTVSPNPATSVVNIEVAEEAVVSIVDLNGRVNGEWRAENGKLTVDVSRMAKGAYFVRIVTEKGTAVRKLIVR